MAETIVINPDGAKEWLPPFLQGDLLTQAGLEVEIVKESARPFGCGGKTKGGTRFFYSWSHDRFFVLYLPFEDVELIEAFSRVLGYRPFCKYVNTQDLLVLEWDKENPGERWEQLESRECFGTLRDLEHLS